MFIEKGEFEVAIKPPSSEGRYSKSPPFLRTCSHTRERKLSAVASVLQYVVDAGFKYRFYPSPEQQHYLARTFGCVRVVYNLALDARKKHYTETGKGLSYGKTSALLTAWKKTDRYPWLREVSSVPLQQTLRHLNTAYQRFFEKKAGYPRYKSRHDKPSATFVKSGFRLSGDGRRPHVHLPKMAEPLAIRWSRDLPSEPTSFVISKDKAGRYFISFRVRLPRTAAENQSGRARPGAGARGDHQRWPEDRQPEVLP